jgi:hypothetical protein
LWVVDEKDMEKQFYTEKYFRKLKLKKLNG